MGVDILAIADAELKATRAKIAALECEASEIETFLRVAVRFGFVEPIELPAALPGAGEVELPPSASPAPLSPETADETVGGLPVAAAPINAEVTGRTDGAVEPSSEESTVAGATEGVQAAGAQPVSELRRITPVHNPALAEPVSETPAPSPGSEAAVDDADAAPAGEASRPDASPAPTSTRQRVKQLHDEHPEYTRREAWEALGITEGSLAGHSYFLGIRWKPIDPVKFERPTPPPPPEDAITPDETVTPSDGFSAPRPSRPKGTQFRLRAGRGEGKYLHMSGVGMTDNRSYAWIGTEAQLVKVRQKFADARDLVEEVVEKEPAR